MSTGRPPLKTVNGTWLVQTKNGWRDIKGMKAFWYDGHRFHYGFIKHVVEDRIQISVPSHNPGHDDKFRNFRIDEGGWNFDTQSHPMGVTPVATQKSMGPRCKRTRTGILPITGGPTQLQCVMRGPHSTCHFEILFDEQVTK